MLAHEIAHAIADQNYNLAKFIKAGRKSDDGSTARLAVMEGQATWLMSELLARKMGQSLKDSPALLAMMSGANETGAGQFPVFDNSPLYLRLTLVFPYTKGMLFQNAVYDRDGQKGFAEVFLKPPVSTQQILHPEKYFSGVKPTQPALPQPDLPKGYKSLVGGSLGELEHYRSCWNSIPARRAPPKLRRIGAAAPSTCWRTRKQAAWCCSTPWSGTTKTPPASISPPIARSSPRNGNT